MNRSKLPSDSVDLILVVPHLIERTFGERPFAALALEALFVDEIVLNEAIRAVEGAAVGLGALHVLVSYADVGLVLRGVCRDVEEVVESGRTSIGDAVSQFVRAAGREALSKALSSESQQRHGCGSPGNAERIGGVRDADVVNATEVVEQF
jgi:hypothetical protein